MTKKQTTEVVVQTQKGETEQKKAPWTEEQIELVKATVARGATNDELKLFLFACQRTGLDPFTRQIHFVKRKVWNKTINAYDEVGTMQTGIDGYRAIAERTGQLAGIDDAVITRLPTSEIEKATVTVYRMVEGQRVGFTASAYWSEYVQVFSGKVSTMWAKMPNLMIGKCAEALALRKAFPNDLSGIYTNEEMAQADINEMPKLPEDKEVKPETKETKPKITINVKSKIMFNLKKLELNPTKENINQLVLDLTKLELKAENYEEINSRLLVLVAEKRNQNGK